MKSNKITYRQCPNCIFPISRFTLYIIVKIPPAFRTIVFQQSYATRLSKLIDSNSVNKDDVLGAEDSSLGASAAAAARSFFGKAATVSRSSSSKTTVFTLGTSTSIQLQLKIRLLDD